MEHITKIHKSHIKYLVIGISCFLFSIISNQFSAQERVLSTANTNVPIDLWRYESFSSLNPNDELKDRRDRVSKHFKNQDGTITAHVASGSIHYEENGEWKTIYHTIVPSASGFENTTNSFKTFYPELASGSIRTVLPNGQTMEDMLNMRLFFEKNGQELIGYNISSVSGSANFNELTYPNAYGNGIDLKLTQNSTKRKMDYIIHDSSALNTIPNDAEFLVFEETIELPKGVRATLRNNTILLTDVTGKLIAVYEKPEILEAQKQVFNNESVENSRRTVNSGTSSNTFDSSIKTALYEVTQTGSSLTIYTKVEVSWLKDTSRSFPITIDPTIDFYPDNATNWTGRVYTDGNKLNGHGRCGRWSGSDWIDGWIIVDFNSLTNDIVETINSVTGYINIYNRTGSASDTWCFALTGDPLILGGAALSASVDFGNPFSATQPGFNANGWRNAAFNAIGIDSINNYLGTRFAFAAAAINATGASQYGDFRDYSHADKPYLRVDYTPPPCSGLPAPGATIVSESSVCSGSSVNLSFQNVEPFTGFAYQWQSSPDGDSWSNISGATNTSHSTAGLTEDTYFRCQVTCTAEDPDEINYSDPELVTVLACVNMHTGSTTTCDALFYDSGGSGGNYSTGENFTHTFYPSEVGASVKVEFTSFNVEFHASCSYAYLRIYDGNSTGAPLIGTYCGTNLPPTYTSTAVDGSLTFQFYSDGISSFPGWEAEISCISPCSGDPDPGDTQVSTNQICSGNTVDLSLQFNSESPGLTYQWQSSPDGSSWSNIIGATNPTHTTAALTDDTHFRCRVTCTNEDPDAIVYSNPAIVYVIPCINMTNGSITTCSALFYDSGGPGGSTSASGAAGNYGNSENRTYTFTPDEVGSKISVLFSDFFTEGNFDFLYIYDGPNTSAPQIPGSPFHGATSPGTYTSTASGGELTFRFTSDGTVNRLGWEAEISCYTPPPCEGTPLGGTVDPASQTVVAGNTTVVTLTGYDEEVSGLSFQWQQSENGTSGWANVTGGSGATTLQYTTPSITQDIYYRCVVTCTNSSESSNSSVGEVIRDICTPTATTDGNTGITRIVFGDIDNSTAGTPAYSDFRNLSTEVLLEESYDLSVRVHTGGTWTTYTKAWIDWNQNGIFEVGEEFTLGTAYNQTNGLTSSSPISITIPNDAVPGETVMRIRSGRSSYPGPCGNHNHSEAEDYTIIVKQKGPAFTNESALDCEVVAFNNIRYNSTTPIFAFNGSDGVTTDIEIEMNTAPNFSGTSYTEIISGSFEGHYNIATTAALGLPATNNVIYYVRVRESKNNQVDWTDWSTITWTYTYSTDTPGYHFTTRPQFEQGNLVSTNYGNYIQHNGTWLASDNLTINQGVANQVSTANADLYLTEGSSNYSGASYNYLTIGSYYLSGQRQDYNGIRFPNAAIPANASILSANLQFYTHHTGGEPAPNNSNPLYLEIVGVNQVNANTWANSTNTATGGPRWRVRRAVKVPWNITASWSDVQLMTSPDISTVVEDLVGVGGYQPGNTLGLIIDYTGGAHGSRIRHRYMSTGRRNSAYRPRLNVTYTNFSNRIKFTNISIDAFGACSKWQSLVTDENTSGCGNCSVTYYVYQAGTSNLVASGSGSVDLSSVTHPNLDLEIEIHRDSGTPSVNSFTFTTTTDSEAATRETEVTVTDICEDLEWTHYLDPDDTSKRLFSVKWGTINQEQKCDAEVKYGVIPANYHSDEQAISASRVHAAYIMDRYWNIEIPGELDEPVSVKFYYLQSDVDDIVNARNARLTDINNDVQYVTHYPVEFSWFKTVGFAFTHDSINDGNSFAHFDHEILTPVESGVENGVNYVVFDNITSFSGGSGGVGIASEDGVDLPVDLLYFNANCDGDKIILNWETATEINSESFRVERSADMFNWEEVVTIAAAGFSSTSISYSVVDKNPLQGISYYRLVQRDFDGTTEIFRAVSVLCEQKSGFAIFPNPARDAFTISIDTDRTMEHAVIEITDMLGKHIEVRSIPLNRGTNTFDFDASRLKPATYIVKVQAGHKLYKPVKLVVSK
jgi:hypothetical protein